MNSSQLKAFIKIYTLILLILFSFVYLTISVQETKMRQETTQQQQRILEQIQSLAIINKKNDEPNQFKKNQLENKNLAIVINENPNQKKDLSTQTQNDQITEINKLDFSVESKLAKDQAKNKIKTLNQLNFYSTINSSNLFVVYFYSKQCEYCSQFEKNYEKIINYFVLNDVKSEIQFGSVMLNSQSEKIFQDYNIQAVPEIKFFYKGLMKSYSYNFVEYDKQQSIQNTIQIIQRINKISKFQYQISKIDIKDSNQLRPNTMFFIDEIQNFESLEERMKTKSKKVFMFNCSFQQKYHQNKDLTTFISNLFIKYLNHQFYCTKNYTSFPGLKKQIIHAYSFNMLTKIFQNINAIDLNAEINYKLKDEKGFGSIILYQQNFQKHQYKQIQEWNNDSVIRTFVDYEPGFILIINNQSRSKSVFQIYKNIKAEFNNNDHIPPISFYVSDLSVKTQQTTRIKKYILGLGVAMASRYPYPILAYMKQKNNKVGKYIFPLQTQINEISMRKWMTDILKQLEIAPQFMETQADKVQDSLDKNLPHMQIKKESQTKINEYFRSSLQSLFTTNYLKKFEDIYYNSSILQKDKFESLKFSQGFTKPSQSIQLVSYYDFRILLSKINQQQFFVYVGWKNDFNSYQLLQDLIDLWELKDDSYDQIITHKNKKTKKQAIQSQTQNKLQVKKEDKYKKLKNLVNIYLLNLNSNDYPLSYEDSQNKMHELRVDYVPSFLYFSSDKKIGDKIQGVKSIQQIQQFMHTKLIKQDKQLEQTDESTLEKNKEQIIFQDVSQAKIANDKQEMIKKSQVEKIVESKQTEKTEERDLQVNP